MNAAYLTETGPPEVIHYGELPEPSIGPQQCLVSVRAVDVNPIDVYQRAGMIPGPARFPHILGRDLAGTVETVGNEVEHFEPGDRVWATNLGFGERSGSFAERVAVDQDWLYPTPDNVRDEDIVAVSLVGVTACLGLTHHGGLRSGDVLFVNGGTGGVGSCVVQMARILGATVITTAGSDEKVQRCLGLGANHAINYRTQDVSQALRELAGAGIDFWWETLRQPDFERTIPLLALGGRMIVMAGRDAKPPFPVGALYTRDCSVRGFAMFNASARAIREAAGAINQWMSEGRLRSQIDRVMPLSEVVEAHRLQEASTVHGTGELSGKIVLTI